MSKLATEDTVEKVLKPCPSGHTRSTRDNNNIYGSWWVKCADCSWRTAGDTEAEAIAAWNTRAAINAMSDVREVETLKSVREKLAQLADKQADQRGDYLYRGQPDSSLLYAIRELDAALESLSGGGK